MTYISASLRRYIEERAYSNLTTMKDLLNASDRTPKPKTKSGDRPISEIYDIV